MSIQSMNCLIAVFAGGPKSDLVDRARDGGVVAIMCDGSTIMVDGDVPVGHDGVGSG